MLHEDQGVGQEENVSLDQTNWDLIIAVRTSCFNDEQMHKLIKREWWSVYLIQIEMRSWRNTYIVKMMRQNKNLWLFYIDVNIYNISAYF